MSNKIQGMRDFREEECFIQEVSASNNLSSNELMAYYKNIVRKKKMGNFRQRGEKVNHITQKSLSESKLTQSIVSQKEQIETQENEDIEVQEVEEIVEEKNEVQEEEQIVEEKNEEIVEQQEEVAVEEKNEEPEPNLDENDEEEQNEEPEPKPEPELDENGFPVYEVTDRYQR